MRLQNSSMFCYDEGNNGVVWALSENVFYTAQQRDNCKSMELAHGFSGCCKVLKFIEKVGKRHCNRPLKRLFSNSTQRVLRTALSGMLRRLKLGEWNL